MSPLKTGEAAKYLPKLQALERDLPSDAAANSAVSTAYENLGRLLAWEALGRDISATEIVDARTTLARAYEQAADLEAMRDALRNLVNEVTDQVRDEAPPRPDSDHLRQAFEAAVRELDTNWRHIPRSAMDKRFRGLVRLAEKAKCMQTLKKLGQEWSTRPNGDLLEELVGSPKGF